MSTILVHCSSRSELPELKRDYGHSLKLVDGSLISKDGIDDYNPVLLRKTDDTLVLVFGSNRDGQHKIFVAASASTYTTGGSIVIGNVAGEPQAIVLVKAKIYFKEEKL